MKAEFEPPKAKRLRGFLLVNNASHPLDKVGYTAFSILVSLKSTGGWER